MAEERDHYDEIREIAQEWLDKTGDKESIVNQMDTIANDLEEE